MPGVQVAAAGCGERTSPDPTCSLSGRLAGRFAVGDTGPKSALRAVGRVII